MGTLIDPTTLVRQMVPGRALIALGITDAASEGMIWLREEAHRIPKWGVSRVEVRTGLLLADGVSLIPVLLRTGSRDDELWEMWINACALGSDALLAALATQQRVLVHWTTETGIARTTALTWHPQAVIATMRTHLAQQPAWSMAAFEAARNTLYQQYPTIPDLWKALAQA